LADFEASLVVTPASVDALHNRASALRLVGRPQDALEQFGACLEVDPAFYLGACGRTGEEENLSGEGGGVLVCLCDLFFSIVVWAIRSLT
jgi:hypothetical protein